MGPGRLRQGALARNARALRERVRTQYHRQIAEERDARRAARVSTLRENLALPQWREALVESDAFTSPDVNEEVRTPAVSS